ncbi:MAG TPA: hypothetical protein VGS96_10805 [Thermoanaerobaculia bacterium]|nr:hypothetical protein [Thermoanaerobaculia bacterium]
MSAGLDPEERVRFRNLLSEIGFGKLVILSTHIVSDVEAIATEIAIMSEGSLIAIAAPEQLLRDTEGKVWEMVIPSHEFERLRGRIRISSAVRRPDGVHTRVVGPENPGYGASPVEPTLEDAFLFRMSTARVAA